MKLSELIKELQDLQEKYQDLKVTIGDREVESARFNKDEYGLPVIALE